MKKIDKLIIVVVTIITTITLTYIGIFHLLISLKVLAMILGAAYGFFILMHLGLCYPLFAICMVIGDNTRDNNILKSIESKSKILWGLVNIVMYSFTLIVVYLGIPLIIAMLGNGSFNVSDAFTLLNLVMGT